MRKVMTLLLLAALPLTARADDGGEQPPAFTAASEGVLAQAQELALRALGFIGIRYKWGGNSPETGFDCSGLIRYVYHEVTGRSLPGNAREISQAGTTIDRSELRPGDLV